MINNISVCFIAKRCSWLDPGRDHGDGVTLIIIVEKSFTMTLHAQIWQCYVITYMNNKLPLVTWSNQNVPIYTSV
jgi:hypothetical protein